MKRKRKQPEQQRSLCAHTYGDDGVDPKEFFKQVRGESSKNDRKTLQLCQQVKKALNLALSGEYRNPILRDVYVESVVAAPDSSRLLATIRPHTSDPNNRVELILGALQQINGRLRHEVTTGIVRKRAPELVFQVGPALEGNE
jgi:ribosome-binding factor A